MVQWKKSGGLLIGNQTAEIRSLRITDNDDRTRRFRACTIWKPFSLKFTKTPAVGRLAKTKDGHIGILVSGKHMGYVKIGKNFVVQNSLTVPFTSVSKAAIKQLSAGIVLVLEELDGIMIAWEK